MPKKQFRGVLILSALLLAILVANSYIHTYYSTQIRETNLAGKQPDLDSLLALMPVQEPTYEQQAENQKEEEAEAKPLNLHPFDPNTISKTDWLAMGLPEKVFNSFEKYRKKGGTIRKAADIRKLYNLDPETAEKMVEFIVIDSARFARPKFAFSDKKPAFEKKVKVLFDLNQADTTQLMGVYGIGRGIANRIVRHRNGLGGFLHKNDVYDVFGLDSAVVEELFTKAYLPENPQISKLNLNTATEEDLARNPYIRRGLAKIIIRYRTQHGDFKQVEDLLQIKIIQPETVKKVKPYLDL